MGLYQSYNTEQLILKYNKKVVREISYACTGHWDIDRQTRRFGIIPETDCPGCGLEYIPDLYQSTSCITWKTVSVDSRR